MIGSRLGGGRGAFRARCWCWRRIGGSRVSSGLWGEGLVRSGDRKDGGSYVEGLL